MIEQVRFDLSELPQPIPEGTEQANLPQDAEQLEPSVLLNADHMDMGWAMIVGIDHHAPALEEGKYSGPASV